MKKVRLLFLSLLCFVLFPSFVSAKTDPYIEKLYMDVTINENGSITVREIDSYKGSSFNGVTASLGYKNEEAPLFRGTRDDFYGSSIYNGSSITNLKVGDIDKDGLTFESINQVNNFYKETSYAYKGDYGVYEKQDLYGKVDLKVYSPSNRRKAIYYEYTINDMVVKHNDIAELAWTIFNGDDMPTSIDTLEIRIHLPKEDSTMRAWGHGVLQGYLDRNSDNLITLHASNVGEYNDLGVRVMFDKELVSSTKYSNINGKENILSVEKELAEEANRIRASAKRKVWFIRISSIIWLLGMLTYLLYTYLKYDKEYKYNLNSEYLRELPATYSPSTLEYLLKHSVSSLSFSTIILDLIRRKVIAFEEIEGKKKDYILKLESKEGLSENENKVISLIFDLVGNGKEVTIQEIKNYAKSESKAQKFLDKFNSWKTKATMEAKQEEFYEKCIKIRVFGVMFSLIAGLLFFLNLALETEVFLTIINLIVGITALIYFLAFQKKTVKGIEHYTKWMAFKKFLKDFGRFNEKELPEIKLWEQYLVYAHILGCAKELEKEMKIKINEVNTGNDDITLMDIYFMNRMMDLNMASTINKTINSAITASNAKIAESRSSSSGGIGGGFSGGGGSFGGGGGRGSF